MDPTLGGQTLGYAAPLPRHPRVAILLDHPAQHFSPAFRRLANSETVDLCVFYWDAREGGAYDDGFGQRVVWDVDLLSGYSWTSPSGSSCGRRLLAIGRELEHRRPEVVLCFGWASPIARAGALWAIARRRPLLLYGDSSWQHERCGLPGFARAGLLRLLFRLSSGALSTGTFNREFYIRHGMRPDRISPGVYPADVTLYTRARCQRTGSGPVIGFAGKLIERKGVHELLSALALLDPKLPWQAVVIGDGPKRAQLEKLAAELGLGTRVEFRGFANQSEMPSLLAECDTVVVPSVSDLRVLIVTEAMAAGAVVVASTATAVWGPGDLLEHGVTGLVYRSGDASDLAAALSSLLESPELVARLRQEAVARLPRHGPEAFARSLEEAAARVLA
jgi:glycosyltransferase involved in cell wall biosynthesis